MILENRYEVVERKAGGMGEVLICRDLQAKKTEMVALKTYLRGGNASGLEARFLREAEAWIRLREADFLLGLKGIVRIDGRPYIVMPYCAGGSLRDRLAKGGVGREQAIVIGTQIAIGMLNLDDLAEMVHRDLKPENILFDGNGEVVISDLGIVKSLVHGEEKIASGIEGGQLTSSGSFVGTLLYAAPEQIIGRTIDKRTDVWAFGTIICEMVLGRPAFADSSPEATASRILTGQPLQWPEFAGIAGPLLTAIIGKCLCKDPTGRFPTFSDLCKAWDELIILEAESESTRAGASSRVLIRSSKVAFHWGDIFPERRKGVRSRLSHPELSAYERAFQFREIERYVEALEACDIVLGRRDDPDSNLSRLLVGNHEWNPTIKRGDLHYEMKAPPRMVLDILELKMVLYVDIIESLPDGRKRLPEFLDLADYIAAKGIPDDRIGLMCAQAYVAGGRLGDAIRILLDLVKRSPKDPRVWGILLVAVVKREGKSDLLRRMVLEQVLPALSGQDDAMSQKICGRGLMMLEDWNQAAVFMLRAYDRNRNDLESLCNACGAYLNGGHADKAARVFGMLHNVAPTSPYTAKLARFFGPNPDKRP